MSIEIDPLAAECDKGDHTWGFCSPHCLRVLLPREQTRLLPELITRLTAIESQLAGLQRHLGGPN